MECPKCGLTNSDTALRCDCGYDFQSNPQEATVASQDKKTSTVTIKDFFKLFLIDKENLVTPLILYINIAIFIIMSVLGADPLSPATDVLMQWGGNMRYLTFNNQFWRLFTSFFLHAGVLHLLFNMYALISIGKILETAIGKSIYILVYIFSGLCSGIASVFWNETVVSVGASGAIFGLYGFYLMLLVLKIVEVPENARKNFLSSIVLFIFYNLFYGFSKAGIDNAAHVGGLLSGIMSGFVYKIAIHRKNKRNGYYAFAALFGLAVAFFLCLKPFVPDNLGNYDAVIKKFSANEERALWLYHSEVLKNLDNVSEKDFERIKTEGIDLWDANIKLIEGLRNLPASLQDQNILLLKYSNLRKESYISIQRLIKNYNETDRKDLEKMTIEIKQILDKLVAK
jgi:rhomboid protease GluP